MNAEYAYIMNAFLPEIVLVGLGLLVLAVDLLLSRANCRRAITLIAAFGCLFVAGISAVQWMNAAGSPPAFVQQEIQRVAGNFYPTALTDELLTNAGARNTLATYEAARNHQDGRLPAGIGLAHPGVAAWWLFANDQFGAAFKVIFALAAFLVLLLSTRFPVARYRGEFVGLLLFATVGLMVMANALDLVVLFLGLELAAVCLYALASWQKDDPRSAEAGTKYLLLGSLASAFFIYGASLLFVKYGSTHLAVISVLQSVSQAIHEPLALIGLLLLLVGFGFKVAAAPFHLWAPDVYQGAPVSLVAFLSTASKAAGFAVLLRALTLGFIHMSPQWWVLIALMAGFSMLIGNLVALHQNNVKRLLAYSGIAQAGYVMIGVMAMGLAVQHSFEQMPQGITAAVLYLFLYTVGNIGAFAVVGIVGRDTGSEEMSAFAGLCTRAPLLTFGMTLLLLSLGGIPLLAGFVGKWFLFLAAVTQGQYLLVLMGAALSVVSIYYYLLIIKQMYILPAADDAKPIRVGGIAAFGLLLIVLLTLAIGIYPRPFLELAHTTAQSLLGW